MSTPSYCERLQLFTARLGEGGDRHEAAWARHLEAHGHPSDRWFGTYLDVNGELSYGQLTRDWPECEVDETREAALAFWEETQAPCQNGGAPRV